MKPNSVNLEQLLRRSDIWRGQSQRFVPQASLSTGHAALNAILSNKGWPLAGLVEVCQSTRYGHSEWVLMAPSIQFLQTGYCFLLNPPAMPFAPGLIQIGVDLDRLLVVQTQNKSDFLSSFTELARAQICTALLAWQPNANMSYTDLRKCSLAAADSNGLRVMFRPLSTQQQSSPAALRITTQLHHTALQINVFKQKGKLTKTIADPIYLDLPAHWMPLIQTDGDQSASPYKRWNKM